MNSVAIFYLVLFGTTLSTISWTLYNFPLFPLNTESLEWSNTWLGATVVDYYGSTLCLCGIILATADSWPSGVLWMMGCCLFGSPVCCLWMLYQILGKKRSLQLAENGDNGAQRNGENHRLM